MQVNTTVFTMSLKAGMFFIDSQVKSDDPNIQYYSFGNERGDFYIMRLQTTDDELNARYAIFSNRQDYDVAWAARESISYDYPWKARRRDKV